MNLKNCIAIALCCGALFLSACDGQTADADPSTQTEAPQSAAETTAAETTKVFDYLADTLPQGWTVNEKYCTPTYLDEVWGEDDNAPRLTVSVYSYEDQYGFGKTEALAAAVKAREKDSSEITTETIGGMDFRAISFPSPEDKTLLRYEFYGQTEPDAKHHYTFVTLTIDRVKDAKQYTSLRKALDVLDFPFGQTETTTKK